MKASEAARLLGVSTSTVSRMVRRGQLLSRPDPRDRRVVLVDREQVEKLASEIRQVHGQDEDDG